MLKFTLSAILFGALAMAETISFSPLHQTIGVGAVTTVDVTIGGLPANEVIGGFDLRVLFNSGIVSAQSITFLGNLGPTGDNLTFSNIGSGFADAAEVSFASVGTLAGLQAGQPFGLFRISFLALAPGTSALNFAASPQVLSDGDGNVISGVTANAGSITVTGGGGGTAVPEPTAWFLLSGLGGLAFRRLRRV